MVGDSPPWFATALLGFYFLPITAIFVDPPFIASFCFSVSFSELEKFSAGYSNSLAAHMIGCEFALDLLDLTVLLVLAYIALSLIDFAVRFLTRYNLVVSFNM